MQVQKLIVGSALIVVLGSNWPVSADEIRAGGFASAVSEFYRLRNLKLSDPYIQWKSAYERGTNSASKGNNARSEKLFREALKIAKEDKLPPSCLIWALDGLYNLLEKTRRCSEAEPVIKQKLAALPGDKQLYAAQFVSSNLSLGMNYRCLNKNELAVKQFKLVIDLERSSKITNLSRIAAFRLAEAYAAIGDCRNQEVICRRFFSTLNQSDRKDALAFRMSLMLAEICLRKHQFKESEQLLQQCLSMPATTRGVTVKERVEVVRLLGDCYLLQGGYAEALDNYQKGLVWAGSAKELDESRSLLNLGVADVYTATAKYKEAEQLYKSSLAQLAVMWGNNEKALVEQIQRYAKFLKVTGRKRDYEALQQKRMQLLRRSLTTSGKR